MLYEVITLTHEAGNTFDGAVFVLGQTVTSSPPGSDLRFLFRIMPDQKFRVIKEVSHEMTESNGHPNQTPPRN